MIVQIENEPRKIRLLVYVTESKNNRMAKYSKALHISKNELINKAIDSYLKQLEAEEETEVEAE